MLNNEPRGAAGGRAGRGKPKSPEHRAKIATATRARWARGEPNPMQGRRHSEATRAQMRAAAERRFHLMGNGMTTHKEQADVTE